MVICPETDMDGALSLAESLRQKVESLDLGDVGLVTISIGAASLDETDDEISFVKRADKALYIAKSKGKNRVELIL
jgi:diguanylate cyclase (GGDEF)-like protein